MHHFETSPFSTSTTSESTAELLSDSISVATSQDVALNFATPADTSSTAIDEEMPMSPVSIGFESLSNFGIAGDLYENILPVPDPNLWAVDLSSDTGIVSTVPQPESPTATVAQLDLERRHSVATIPPAQHFSGEPTLTISPSTDTSTYLISNWFNQVCTVWSGFDSNTNLNRTLAIDLWQNSPLVFSSLRGMSAAFLSTRLPQMRRTARKIMQDAVEAIQSEVKIVKSRPQLDTIPTGLLFSLFCVGTTLCWIDANQLGSPFVKEARIILRRLDRQFLSCYKKDLELLSFFNKSLAYCEMLLAAVDDDYPVSTVPMGPCELERDTSADADKKSIDGTLHPWTGISTLTSRLFTQSLRLCRAFRHNVRKPTCNGRDLESALQEIQQAQVLEAQLLKLEFPSLLRLDSTGDEHTPSDHLTRVAEAYKIASLLHLYETFPDLATARLTTTNMSNLSNDRPALWEEWITPLTLRLVKILELIPVSSGSRVIQPLLYISASTGLRYDTATLMDVLDPSRLFNEPTNPRSPPDTGMSSDSISDMALEISNARHFVMSRLGVMENSLPPRPVVTAKQLVTAIWDAYDGEMPGSTTVHWIDVMEDQNLRSLFG